MAGAYWKPTLAARTSLMADAAGRAQSVSTGMIELDRSPASAALFHKMIWESMAADARFASINACAVALPSMIVNVPSPLSEMPAAENLTASLSGPWRA